MMKKTYSYIMAFLGVCIVCAGLGYFLLIKNVWSKAALISSYKNEIAFGDQKNQYAESMLRSFETTQGDIDNLQNFFVKKQGEVQFIEFIEGVAKNEGLVVGIDTLSLDSSEEMKVHGMEYLVLRFHVSGPWSRVWNFSQSLEVLPYSVDVESLALIREDTKQTTGPVMWKGVYNIRILKKK